MTAPATSLAWIDGPGPDGRWGAPADLGLPLGDRGLLLADGLFETVLVLDGEPRLLKEHLQRWQAGAHLLGLEPPPAPQRVEALVREALARSGIASGALRLNWSRGLPVHEHSRGLSIPKRCQHRFWLQLHAAVPSFAPLVVQVNRSERRDPRSVLSRCKTFAYAGAIQARRQAAAAGADDALLTSTSGALCCGTSANLLLRSDDHWLTPPLSSGCLPGVMRARALQRGVAREAPLRERDLHHCSGAVLINSLGCRPLRYRRKGPATGSQPTSEQEAAALWRTLL
jgi:branched-subunit amino acid aminotransferase/4-amino-4-deoxychorismate lyase